MTDPLTGHELSPRELRELFNELVNSDLPDDELVPIPCQCNPRRHPVHYVKLGTIRSGGRLHGKIDLEGLYE